MTNTTIASGTTKIIVPDGGYLRVVVKGEESTPIDLLPMSAALLDLRTPVDAEEEADEAVPADQVDFAVLECSDEIVFERDGVVLEHEQALAELAAAVVNSIRAAVDQD